MSKGKENQRRKQGASALMMSENENVLWLDVLRFREKFSLRHSVWNICKIFHSSISSNWLGEIQMDYYLHFFSSFILLLELASHSLFFPENENIKLLGQF